MTPLVAVIGASRDRRKFGNKAVRAFAKRGYRVVPVNPHEREIEGLAAVRSVRDIAGPIDIATLYVRPAVGETLAADLAARRVGEVWINPGAGSPGLVARLAALGLRSREHCSLMAIGEDPGDY
jgi:hypothetical protein